MDISEKSEAVGSGIRRAKRRMRTLEEKRAIVEEATQPGASVASVARKHGVNANLVFGWIRLHERGLLERQRGAKSAPMLPVQITPPRQSSRDEAKQGTREAVEPTVSSEAMLEIVLGDGTRLCVRGEAQREVLDRLLEWLPRR